MTYVFALNKPNHFFVHLGSLDGSLRGGSTPGDDNLLSSQESLNMLNDDSITSMELDFKEFEKVSSSLLTVRF